MGVICRWGVLVEGGTVKVRAFPDYELRLRNPF